MRAVPPTERNTEPPIARGRERRPEHFARHSQYGGTKNELLRSRATPQRTLGREVERATPATRRRAPLRGRRWVFRDCPRRGAACDDIRARCREQVPASHHANDLAGDKNLRHRTGSDLLV